MAKKKKKNADYKPQAGAGAPGKDRFPADTPAAEADTECPRAIPIGIPMTEEEYRKLQERALHAKKVSSCAQQDDVREE